MKDRLRAYVIISLAAFSLPFSGEPFNSWVAMTGIITELTLRRHFTFLIVRRVNKKKGVIEHYKGGS